MKNVMSFYETAISSKAIVVDNGSEIIATVQIGGLKVVDRYKLLSNQAQQVDKHEYQGKWYKHVESVSISGEYEPEETTDFKEAFTKGKTFMLRETDAGKVNKSNK